MGQFVTRIDSDLAAQVDKLVEEGIFDSRSDAVRQALATMVEAHRRTKVGDGINEGYRRIPLTERQLDYIDRRAELMIEEEPW